MRVTLLAVLYLPHAAQYLVCSTLYGPINSWQMLVVLSVPLYSALLLSLLHDIFC